MKRALKEEIVGQARLQFSESGYDSVSLRSIAEALHISVGNLTYHYGRKEEIAAAVLLAAHAQYRLPQAPDTLQALCLGLLDLAEQMQQNALFSKGAERLLCACPEARPLQQELMARTGHFIGEALLHLQDAGLICRESYPGQFVHLSHALLLLCLHFEVQGVLSPCERRRAFLRCVWSVLYPNLTAEGRRRPRAQLTGCTPQSRLTQTTLFYSEGH
ncbi:MAG: TetR/AcrR family transcriptional regulator [Clostridiales bacterium]|nr:TetR/AcrR family transcriptional regulator [Clostridiales bacterium]